MSITTPVSHLANEFDVQSELHGQVSLAAVNQILCHLWGYEWLQKSKDSLKACFENVNICDMYLNLIWSLLQIGSDVAKPEVKSPKKSSRKRTVPQRTLPMIPEICFASSTDNPNPFGSNTMLDKDGLSPLLVCEDCKVCVHASK